MKIGSIQLEKRLVMTVAIISMLMSGCEDRFDSGGGNPAGGGEPVEVNLNIGFADEADGYELAPSSSSKAGDADHEGAFDCELVPSAQTRSGSVKPDALYNLEIRQYKSDNTCLNTSATAVVEKANIGSRITVTLKEAKKCQLVLVAWGNGNSRRLGTAKLDAVKDTIGSYLIKDLKPGDQSDMNKMPYVLHLKDVNVSNDGRIYSNEGEAIDIRLRLKRLAARLTFKWTYSVSGYTPQQILIQGIPTNYKVVASPDKKDNTYPSLLDQFTTMQATISVAQTTGQTVSGTYSCWIPANVRGTSSAASTATSRTKANAPTGSSYIRFISVKNGEGNANQKLDYRIYLGGKESTDFNVRENTNYIYEVTFNHEGLPVNDRRVTIVDPSPASQGNSNFVNTANCFMVPPGGAFCFNPYKYTQNGAVVDNTVLQGWCSGDTRIKSVKVLWQTLENGDVGDPVLGTVNSPDDHTNIVDLKNGDSFADARIYCRVAPNTTGGSGLIAAYSGENGGGNILWSWHIWVTDYNPDATGNNSVDEPTKRKLKFKYNISGTDQLPMMDRNLGAMAGYTDAPPNPLEKSKTHGFHYEWGRKDLFPSSYTSDDKTTTVISKQTEPTKGLLNLYAPDGFTFCPLLIYTAGKVSYQTAYQNPTTLYKPNDANLWNDLNNLKTAWGGDASKTVHDPCPAGWRVTKITDYQSLFQSTPGVNQSTALNLKNGSNLTADGGAVLYFEAKGSGRTTYIRFTGYWNGTTSFGNIGLKTLLWCRDDVNSGGTDGSNKEAGRYLDLSNTSTSGRLNYSGHLREAITLRCIQERAD